MKVYKVTLGILFGFAMISCESDTYDKIGGYVENPSYQKNIKPVFDSQCASCHSLGNTKGGGTEIYDYATTRQSVEFGNTLRDIDSTHTMPKSAAALSKAKIKLIYQWKKTDYQP